MDQVADAVGVGNEGAVVVEAVDVIFAVDYEAGGAPVGFDLPFRGHDRAGNVYDAPDHGDEFPPGEMFLEESANGIGKIGQPIDPQDFMPLRVANGDAVACIRKGEGPHGLDAGVRGARRVGQDQPAPGVVVKLKTFAAWRAV